MTPKYLAKGTQTELVIALAAASSLVRHKQQFHTSACAQRPNSRLMYQRLQKQYHWLQSSAPRRPCAGVHPHLHLHTELSIRANYLSLGQLFGLRGLAQCQALLAPGIQEL